MILKGNFIKGKLVCTRATKAKREWIILRLWIGKDKRRFLSLCKNGQIIENPKDI